MNNRKINIKITILRIIGTLFLIFQALAYLGGGLSEMIKLTDTAEKIGYLIGFNFPIYISIILFLWAKQIKKNSARKQSIKGLDSIGIND